MQAEKFIKSGIAKNIFSKHIININEKQPFLYVEYGKLFVKNNIIVLEQENEDVEIPIATINALLIGAGTSITHDVFKIASKYNCIINIVGNDGIIFYSTCLNTIHDNRNFTKQIFKYYNDIERLEIVKKMFLYRFINTDINNKTIDQLKGMEGIRIKNLYKELANKYNVEWSFRKSYGFLENEIDETNKYITLFNQFLYGILNSVILSLGYSPQIGFIHENSPLAFSYDIADLFKKELSIEPAFKLVSDKNLFDKKIAINVFKDNIINFQLIKKTICFINDIL